MKPISNGALDLGEGPFWDEKQQCLWLVDAFVGDICRLDVNTGHLEKHNLGDLVTIVIPFENSNDDLLVTLRNKVLKLNWKTKETELIAEVAPERNGEKLPLKFFSKS